MLENVHKTACMFEFAPAMAPASRIKVPRLTQVSKRRQTRWHGRSSCDLSRSSKKYCTCVGRWRSSGCSLDKHGNNFPQSNFLEFDFEDALAYCYVRTIGINFRR